MKRIAIIGGHTEWARSLVELIEERELDVEYRRYSSSEKLGSEDHLLGPETLQFADCLVLTESGDFARGLAEGAKKLGKVIVDMVGALHGHEDATYVWPMLDAQATGNLNSEKFTLIPQGLASPVVAVMRALSSRGVKRLNLATYESASVYDREGMDELLAQTRAVCALQEPESEVLPAQLAFSAIRLEQEDRLESQIALGLTDFELQPEIVVSRVMIPTFSADAAVLHIELGEETDKDQVIQSLKAAKGLQIAKDLESAVDCQQREDALISQVDVVGKVLRIFLCADRRTRGSATPTVLMLERWLQ